ncbi:MAG TPA: 5-formyltetrahydrofolate cyclo-ligase, partial [Pseudomonadales bacterium]|nr:5-formyltetrahydrofolate cyclo-ligase [Pseudomonadales bacterium]
ALWGAFNPAPGFHPYRNHFMLKAADYPNRTALRKALRQARRRLTRAEQRHAAERLCALLRQTPKFIHARDIAVYMANDGEIDPRPFVDWARRHRKRIWLPLIHPLQHNHMRLALLGQRWKRNRFGIQEPAVTYADTLPAWRMDVICLPLVGFDAHGNRLGMGKGFYDRTLAFLRDTRPIKAPLLVGLAHACQQVDSLPAADWDVPLDLIATDREIMPVIKP